MGIKTCFVIGPIGSEGSEERNRADTLFKYVIENVISDFNLDVIRADHISEPGLITQQIINNIRDAEFLIADLHGLNPNVFYELALAHALKKNLIQFYTKGQRLPFDVKDLRSIMIDMKDIPSYEKAKIELKNQIESVINNPDSIQNPFSIAMDLQQLTSSENSYERTTALIFDQLKSINSRLSNVSTNHISVDRRPYYLVPINLDRSKYKNCETLLELIANDRFFAEVMKSYQDQHADFTNYSKGILQYQINKLIAQITPISNSKGQLREMLFETLGINIHIGEEMINVSFTYQNVDELIQPSLQGFF